MNESMITLRLTDKEAATLLRLVENTGFEFGGSAFEYGTAEDQLQSIHDKIMEEV